MKVTLSEEDKERNENVSELIVSFNHSNNSVIEGHIKPLIEQNCSKPKVSSHVLFTLASLSDKLPNRTVQINLPITCVSSDWLLNVD